MSDMNAAIEDAKKEIEANNKAAGVDTPPEDKEDTTVDDTDDNTGNDPGDETDDNDDEDIADVELSDLEKDESQRLYKALRDPVKGVEILKALAAQAGLLGRNAPETPRETKAAQKAVTEILSEALGKDYAFLADKLGPAIEAVFEQHETALEEKFSRIETDKVIAQTEQIRDKMNRLTNGEAGKLWPKMEALAEKIRPSEDTSPEEYIRHLFVLAGGKLPQTNGKNKNERIQRNANDIGERLSGRGTAGPGGKDPIPVAKTSKEAVEMAMAQLKKGKNSW